MPIERLIRSLCRTAFITGVSILAPLSAHAGIGPEQIPVTVRVEPIETFHVGRETATFGSLTFLGGLELLPDNRHVGGLSGLIVTHGGSGLIAIADNGLWFEADLVADADGRPRAVRNARVAPLLDEDGVPLANVGKGDTEALTLRRTNGAAEMLVSTERDHRVYAFPYPLDPDARARELDMPPGVRRLRHNKGMEALAAANSGPLAGTLVIIAERGPTFTADMPGFLIGGPHAGTFTVARSDAYDATDAAFLPGGDLLLLERRFTLRHGIGMRIRRIPATELVAQARVEGEILLEAGFTSQIDNMEGIAVHVASDGTTVITLISDDNRSILQRTLLLRFRLEDG